MNKKKVGCYIVFMLIFSVGLIGLSYKTKEWTKRTGDRHTAALQYEMGIRTGNNNDEQISTYSQKTERLYVMNRIAGALDIAAPDTKENEQGFLECTCIKRINIGQLASVKEIDCRDIDEMTISENSGELVFWRNKAQVMKIRTNEFI